MQTRDWIETLAVNKPNIHIVKGDNDQFSDLPETKTIEISTYKIGLIHGHQVVPWGDKDALCQIMRDLECDILISGQTHKCSIHCIDGRYLINPGSATGAYSGLSEYTVD